MTLNEILSSPVVTALAAGLSSLITYMITRRRRTMETQKLELELVEMWQRIADDLRKEVITLTEKCDRLTDELQRVEQKMKEFTV